MMPADDDGHLGVDGFESGSNLFDDVGMAGKAGKSDQGRAKAAEGLFDRGFQAGIENRRPVAVLLERRPEVFEGEGLEEIDLVDQRLAARRLDEQHVHGIPPPDRVIALILERLL